MFKTLFNKIGWAAVALAAFVVVENIKTPSSSRKIGCTSPEVLEELNRSITVDIINATMGWLPPEKRVEIAQLAMKKLRYVATHVETMSGDSNGLLCRGLIKTVVPGLFGLYDVPDDSEYDLTETTKYTVQKNR